MENKHVTGTLAAGGGFLAWLSSLDLPSISYGVGIFVALAGLGLGFYWQWRKDKRDQRIMEATLEALKTKGVSLHDDE
jgi:uncharacterized membrane protein YebE (DUF533 family)